VGLLLFGPAKLCPWYEAQLEAVRRAQVSVDLCQYFVAPGEVWNRFAQALMEATARGVAVRLLLDAIGARELPQREDERLRQAGVAVRRYNPMKWYPLRWHNWQGIVHRNHRKILLVDGKTLFSGGPGVADVWCGAPNPWWDYGFCLDDHRVSDWTAVFEHDWHRLKPGGATLAPRREGLLLTEPRRTVGGKAVDLRWAVQRQIRESRHHVTLVTPYLLPTHRLLKALIEAACRGVEVRLLLPGERVDHFATRQAGRRHYAALMGAGVRIFELPSAFLHAKAMVVDGQWATLGSANFDRFGLGWNAEGNLETRRKDEVLSVMGLLARTEADMVEIRTAPSSPGTRFFGWLSDWLGQGVSERNE